MVQALCQLQVPHAVPLEGSISYPELSAKVNVSEDRLKHLIRIAAICSNFLTETENGDVAHSPNSAIWQLDPTMANGMEVMMNHLPPSAYRLGDVCTQDPVDEDEKLSGFSLARGEPLFQYLETHPDQGRKFAAHMRAQAAQSGDEAIQEGYDWHTMKEKTLVDVSWIHAQTTMHTNSKFQPVWWLFWLCGPGNRQKGTGSPLYCPRSSQSHKLGYDECRKEPRLSIRQH